MLHSTQSKPSTPPPKKKNAIVHIFLKNPIFLFIISTAYRLDFAALGSLISELKVILTIACFQSFKLVQYKNQVILQAYLLGNMELFLGVC